jgi:signal transduction histidine kinase
VKFTIEELRPLSIFAGLSDEQLGWFCEHGAKLELAAGDRVIERGQPADFMFVVVHGKLEGYEEIGGQWLLAATTEEGQATGTLPFSRMTHYPRFAVAPEPTEILRVRKSDFPEMIAISYELGQRLVAQMSDRVRGDVRLKQQQEKLMALGKLSAGLAHELNNPAAAIQRSASALLERLARLPALATTVFGMQLDEKSIHAIGRLPEQVRPLESMTFSPLERSEREEELTAWMEEAGVADPWQVAATFADSGLTVGDLESLRSQVPAQALGRALVWVECGLAAERAAAEIASSSERISALIASIKSYSHMDRSLEHKPTDVRLGLDNTLTMLGHKIARNGIRVSRRYEEDLPPVSGNAGELNQVWTNLIDNAIDAMAMKEAGELSIEVGYNDGGVVVKVIDNGAGIPEDVRPHIFEPFYTTKGVGEGTGLGLDIALRIVRLHRGTIEVQSRPGRTELRVQLPRHDAPRT